MQENMFLKSILRQPVRSFLLILLIAAASFAFVVRSVEYIVVREQIQTIAGFYNSVGILTPISGDFSEDVFAASEFISSIPSVSGEDRRRGVEAILRYMHNPIYIGEVAWFMYYRDMSTPDLLGEEFDGSWAHLGNYFQTFRYEYAEIHREWTPFLHEAPGFMSGDAFFYGELLDVNYVLVLPDDWHFTAYGYFAPHKNMLVRVDYVYAGYIDHVDEGVEIILRFNLIDGIEPFNDLEIGGRYFFKATYYLWLGTGSFGPHSRMSLDPNVLFPKPLSGHDIWYIPVATGEAADFTLPELSHIPDEILFTNHVQRAMHLRTTRDMNSLPDVARGMIGITDGRLLDENDYNYARPVTVVNRHFARLRGLSIGSTVTVQINPEQHLLMPHYAWPLEFDQITLGKYTNLGILSVPGTPPVYELDLEVVGIFDWFPERFGGTVTLTTLPKLMYIPDSVLPGDIGILTAPWGIFDPEHVPAVWYSFTLGDSRDEAGFLSAHRDTLAAMGFNLEFIGRDSTSFWTTADMIMQSITLNLILFSLVLLLVLGLVVFVYLWQRRKDFAVLRALGCPKKVILKQVFVAAAVFWLPAIIGGGIVAWNFAHEMAKTTIEPFGEIIADSANIRAPSARAAFIADFLDSALPSPWVLVGLCALVIIVMLIIVWFGTRKLINHPVLELLQGTVAKARYEKDEANKTKEEKNTTPLVPKYRPNIKTESHILRHIVRTPVKTLLVLGVTLFFVVALGWLGETVNRAEDEINRLFDTTIVYANILRRSDDPERRTRLMFDIIPKRVVDAIYEYGFVHDGPKFIEAANGFSIILPKPEDGQFPHEVLYDAILSRYDDLPGGGVFARLLLDTFDGLIAVNDLRHYTEDRQGFIGRLPGVGNDNLKITYAPGFDESDFVFTAGQPVPIIISERVRQQRGVNMGDMVIIAYVDYNHYLTWLIHTVAPETLPEWHYISAQVIGIHNDAIFEAHMQNATLVPPLLLESLLGDSLGYMSFRFGINPHFNRYLDWTARRIRTSLVVHRGDWFNHLDVDIRDEELRLVVEPMEQNLSLLRLLYPIVIILSIIIGMGLTILLTMQNAKNAAILRVLGVPKRTARLMLWLELMIVSIAGALIGLVILVLMRQGINTAIFIAAAPYIIGAVIGAAIGAIMVTNRAPLDLLQVKE